MRAAHKEAFVDGLVEESGYSVQRKLLQDRFDSLVVPELNAAYSAGEVLESLKEIWGLATMEEKNRLLRTMLEAIYLDLASSKSVVGILPKGPFYSLFQSLRDDPDAPVRVYDPETETDSESEPEVLVGMVETGGS